MCHQIVAGSVVWYSGPILLTDAGCVSACCQTGKFRRVHIIALQCGFVATETVLPEHKGSLCSRDLRHFVNMCENLPWLELVLMLPILYPNMTKLAIHTECVCNITQMAFLTYCWPALGKEYKSNTVVIMVHFLWLVLTSGQWYSMIYAGQTEA